MNIGGRLICARDCKRQCSDARAETIKGRTVVGCHVFLKTDEELERDRKDQTIERRKPTPEEELARTDPAARVRQVQEWQRKRQEELAMPDKIKEQKSAVGYCWWRQLLVEVGICWLVFFCFLAGKPYANRILNEIVDDARRSRHV